MRRIILNFLIRLFLKEQRDIKKISLGDELSKYRFLSCQDVQEILKHNRTAMTLWHFETNNKGEMNIVKGMALMLNILLDANQKAIDLNEVGDIEKRLYLWKKYKDVEKTKIWNNIIKVNRGSDAK